MCAKNGGGSDLESGSREFRHPGWRAPVALGKAPGDGRSKRGEGPNETRTASPRERSEVHEDLGFSSPSRDTVPVPRLPPYRSGPLP